MSKLTGNWQVITRPYNGTIFAIGSCVLTIQVKHNLALQELHSRHLVRVGNYVDATSTGLGPWFLLKDESWIHWVSKWFIYPTCRAARAGCLQVWTPLQTTHSNNSLTNFPKCTTCYPIPNSKHLIQVHFLGHWAGLLLKLLHSLGIISLVLLHSASICQCQLILWCFIKKSTLRQLLQPNASTTLASSAK